jgi:hypothetical protein
MMSLPRTGVLLFGVVAGPLAWVVQFALHYGLSPRMCGGGTHGLPTILTGVGLVVTAAALVTAYRALRLITTVNREAADERARISERSRNLAFAGVLSSAFFLLVLVVTAAPIYVIDPCRDYSEVG